MRLVLDTNVMVAAIRSSGGASHRLLAAALTHELTLVASVPLMIEYQAVMTRLEHLTVSGLSAADIDVLLDAVASVAEPVRLAFLWRPIVKDPDDDMVFETAVNGRAEAIVTFNTRDFAHAGLAFGIDVLTPSATLKKLEKLT